MEGGIKTVRPKKVVLDEFGAEVEEENALPTSPELDELAPTDPNDPKIQVFRISEIDIAQVEVSAKKMVTRMMYPVINQI